MPHQRPPGGAPPARQYRQGLTVGWCKRPVGGFAAAPLKPRSEGPFRYIARAPRGVPAGVLHERDELLKAFPPLPGDGGFPRRGLFTSALPEKLINLPSPTAQHISADESERTARLFDERSNYAYHPHGARNPENGHQRFKGPANANKLRCPNNLQSMRLGYQNPETNCTPGSDCGCAGTITLTPDEHARESQWPLFGTTAWRKLYGARNAVESFNADVRTNKLSWRRGYVKAFTRTRNAFLLAVSLASLNFRIVRDWCFKRRLQNLWGGEVWDYGPEPKQSRRRRTKAINYLVSN